MDSYNNNSGRGTSGYDDDRTGGGFDNDRRGAGGLGGSGYGDDSFGSSGRDDLGGSTVRDNFDSSTGRDPLGSSTGRGDVGGLGRDTLGRGGRDGGLGDDSYDTSTSGRTGGVRDNAGSFARDTTTGRDDPRTAETNYAGAPIRSGPFTGTDADTYGSTGTGTGLGGSSRVTDTDRGDTYGRSGTGTGTNRFGDDSFTGGLAGKTSSTDYGSSGRDNYGGSNTANRKGSGNDSTLGKLVEKVGDMTKNPGLQEKGRTMREQKGFDNSGTGVGSTYDDPNIRSGRNDNF